MSTAVPQRTFAAVLNGAQQSGTIPLPDTSIEARWVLVTVELAETFIARQRHNRNRIHQVLAKYVRDMATHSWLAGTSLLFDATGRMIDGQHRCWAIMESGEPQWMLCVTGLDRRTQEVMDQGAVRKWGQQLHLRGVQNAAEVAAATRCVAAYEHTGMLMTRGGSTQFTHSELDRMLEKHPTVAALQSVTVRGLTPGMFRAFRYLASLADADDEASFTEQLRSMRWHGHGQESIGVLRRRLDSEMQKRDPTPPWVRAVFLIKIWNLWRRGETIQTLRFAMGGRAPETPPLIDGCPILPRAADAL